MIKPRGTMFMVSSVTYYTKLHNKFLVQIYYLTKQSTRRYTFYTYYCMWPIITLTRHDNFGQGSLFLTHISFQPTISHV